MAAPNASSVPKTADRLLLCLELLQSADEDRPRFTIVASHGGPGGTHTYSYGVGGIPLTPTAYEGLVARWLKLMTDHVLLAGGVQGVLLEE